MKQNLLSLVSLLVGLRTYQHPCNKSCESEVCLELFCWQSHSRPAAATLSEDTAVGSSFLEVGERRNSRPTERSFPHRPVCARNLTDYFQWVTKASGRNCNRLQFDAVTSDTGHKYLTARQTSHADGDRCRDSCVSSTRHMPEGDIPSTGLCWCRSAHGISGL